MRGSNISESRASSSLFRLTVLRCEAIRASPSLSVATAYVAAHEIHDLLRRSAGQKNPRDARLLQPGDIRLGNNSAHQHGHILHVFGPQQIHDLWAERIVRARK